MGIEVQKSALPKLFHFAKVRASSQPPVMAHHAKEASRAGGQHCAVGSAMAAGCEQRPRTNLNFPKEGDFFAFVPINQLIDSLTLCE